MSIFSTQQLNDNSISNHISGYFSGFVRCRYFIFPGQGQHIIVKELSTESVSK